MPGQDASLMYLKHALYFGDSSSNPLIGDRRFRLNIYTLNTPPHVAIPAQDISWTRPLLWRYRFVIDLKHDPSFGEFGST